MAKNQSEASPGGTAPPQPTATDPQPKARAPRVKASSDPRLKQETMQNKVDKATEARDL